MTKKVKGVTFPSAECDWCKRRVELLKVGDERRFVTHMTRNGRACHNAYGRPKGEVSLPAPAAENES